MRKVVIVGAGGRDFHNFNVVFRGDPARHVVAFTAAQIPGIDHRVYPPALAGPDYPTGIPIRPESELADIIRVEGVDEVVLAYSDLSHQDVMHKASLVLAAGADFRLLGPKATMIHSVKPVVAVCATRTGSGKSQTTRRVGEILQAAGLRVAIVRHPMPYHDLDGPPVRRFSSLTDIDRSHPTIEEREEFEEPVSHGLVVFAGIDYAEVLHAAEAEADVVVWDGGNNDFPFFAADLLITVADPLRPGHEVAYHPGETNLRMADVVVLNKLDTADALSVDLVLRNLRSVNPSATVVRADSPVTLDAGPSLVGKRVLVVEDGPTITHGGMPYGAGTVAARNAGVVSFVNPRPFAVGSLRETFVQYPGIGAVLPAMGYSNTQIHDLEQTIDACDCDVVVSGTPIDLSHVVKTRHPIRRASYSLREQGSPDLSDVLAPLIEKAEAIRP